MLEYFFVDIIEDTEKVLLNFHLTFARLMNNQFCKCYLNITFEWSLNFLKQVAFKNRRISN